MDERIFDISKQRYEQEISRSQHIDQKTSNQIGFVGIIIAVISFIYGSNGVLSLPNAPNLGILIIGIVLLLISIGIGILILTPFVKSHPIFNIKKFYTDYKNEDKNELDEMMLQVYFGLIKSITTHNNQKAVLMYVSNWIILLGLGISFISFLIK